MTLTQVITLKASGAVAAAGTVTGDAIKFNRTVRSAVFLLDVTALATDSNDTLDVYIDTSYDGGTSWVNIGHFTQILGNGLAAKHAMSFPENASTYVTVTSDASGGAVRALPIGDRVRYRSVVVDPTGSNVSFTFSVKGFVSFQ